MGRTRIVPNSCEPMWAAAFLLPMPRNNVSPDTQSNLREVKLKISPASWSAPPQETEEPIIARNISFEIWNDDPGGSFTIIGRAVLPPDLLSDLLRDEEQPESAENTTTIKDHNHHHHNNDDNNRIHKAQESKSKTRNDRCSLVLDLCPDNTSANVPYASNTPEDTSCGTLSISVERIYEVDSECVGLLEKHREASDNDDGENLLEPLAQESEVGMPGPSSTDMEAENQSEVKRCTKVLAETNLDISCVCDNQSF